MAYPNSGVLAAKNKEVFDAPKKEKKFREVRKLKAQRDPSLKQSPTNGAN
jgi:hypothetical protein